MHDNDAESGSFRGGAGQVAGQFTTGNGESECPLGYSGADGYLVV
jgi:hypothetical protein